MVSSAWARSAAYSAGAMDYCHQCQRHLNGALACAGCGTPVEELRRDDPHISAADRVFELARDEEVPPAAPRRAQRGTSRRATRASGRRARRRRGRNILLGFTGLVLAAGALSLARLAMEHPAGGGPATAVRQDDVAEPEPLPDPSDSAEPPEDPDTVDESASVSEPSGGVSVSADAGAGEDDGEDDGGGGASGVPGASASGDGAGVGSEEGAGPDKAKGGLKGSSKPDASPSSSASLPASSSVAPSATSSAPIGDPAPDPTTVTPAPASTETCRQWLWWCF